MQEFVRHIVKRGGQGEDVQSGLKIKSTDDVEWG
jgi:hypothetical protein